MPTQSGVLAGGSPASAARTLPVCSGSAGLWFPPPLNSRQTLGGKSCLGRGPSSLIVKKQDGKGPQTWELVPEACPHLTRQANIGKNKGKADGKIPPSPAAPPCLSQKPSGKEDNRRIQLRTRNHSKTNEGG